MAPQGWLIVALCCIGLLSNAWGIKDPAAVERARRHITLLDSPSWWDPDVGRVLAIGGIIFNLFVIAMAFNGAFN